jgi:serine/threonine protein kinase
LVNFLKKVYTAHSIINNRKNNSKKNVILKILNNLRDEQSLSEFHRDIEIFSKVRHENIVRLIDICTNKDGYVPNIVILEHSEFVS